MHLSSLLLQYFFLTVNLVQTLLAHSLMHHGTFKKHHIVSTLASHFRCDSEIILPKDNRWSAISERWTKYLAPSFRVAVKPGCEADLVAIVRVSCELRDRC